MTIHKNKKLTISIALVLASTLLLSAFFVPIGGESIGTRIGLLANLGLNNRSDNIVATVNGEEICYYRIRTSIDGNYLLSGTLRAFDDVLNFYIERTLLIQAARNNGVFVDEDAIRDNINRDRLFFANNAEWMGIIEDWANAVGVTIDYYWDVMQFQRHYNDALQYYLLQSISQERGNEGREMNDIRAELLEQLRAEADIQILYRR